MITLSKELKSYIADTYEIHENYLFLKNHIFKDMETIKQLKIYPPKDRVIRIIVVYEIPDTELLSDNGKYLSIDLGIKKR